MSGHKGQSHKVQSLYKYRQTTRMFQAANQHILIMQHITFA